MSRAADACWPGIVNTTCHVQADVTMGEFKFGFMAGWNFRSDFETLRQFSVRWGHLLIEHA